MLRRRIATVLIVLLASGRIQAFATSRRSSRRQTFPRSFLTRVDPTGLASSASDDNVNEVATNDDNNSGQQNLNAGSNPLSTGTTRTTSSTSIMMIKGYDPSEGLPESVNVGDPQIRVAEKERSVTSILRELVAIQQKGPQKYCILGTRHCSYMHQQIIELL